MNLNEQLNQAYNAGRRQGLNEQGMMSNMNATSVPQTGGGLGGGGNQYPSMMSNNSATAVPNYRSGDDPMGPMPPKPFAPTINDPERGPIMPVGDNLFVDAYGQYWTWDGKRFVRSKY